MNAIDKDEDARKSPHYSSMTVDEKEALLDEIEQGFMEKKLKKMKTQNAAKRLKALKDEFSKR